MTVKQLIGVLSVLDGSQEVRVTNDRCCGCSAGKVRYVARERHDDSDPFISIGTDRVPFGCPSFYEDES